MTASPVRAGFVIDSLAPGAGTENQLLFLLRAFDRSRVDPHLVCLADSPALAALRETLPVHVLGIRRMLSPGGWRGLRAYRRILARGRIDVVVTFFRDANIVGTLGAWGTGAAVVSSRRNLGGGYWHTPNELRILRLLNRRTTLWAANSEAVRAYTAEAERVPADRIRVVPNAVDAARFHPPSAEERVASRAALGLEADAPVVGCVANLRPVKGLEMLLSGFAKIASAHPRARLVLVGEGPLEEALRADATRLGIGERVHFLGGRADVAEVVRAFDVAALTSKGEGYSNALLEGAATGLPLLATDVGGNRELVAGAACGKLVPAGDVDGFAAALDSLLKDPGERAALGARGRARVVERHAPDAVLGAWAELLEEARDARRAQRGIRST